MEESVNVKNKASLKEKKKMRYLQKSNGDYVQQN